MAVNRREFMQGVGLTGAAVALGGKAQGEVTRPREEGVVLKLSSQEGRIPGATLAQKVERMQAWGFTGIEPWGTGLAGRVDEYRKVLEGSNVRVSAVCAGFKGCLVSHDEGQRQLAVATIKEILPAAGALKAAGLIVVPAFHNQTKLSCKEIRPLLIEKLKELGEFAAEHGTRILLEPLNRGECYFLRLVADAAAIARDSGSPGVAVMGDFFHMGIEEPSDRGAFISGGKYLKHVHLASRRRVMPGQDERSFVDGFKGLKEIGYEGYCSLECGCDGDAMVEVPKAVRYLKDQWEQA